MDSSSLDFEASALIGCSAALIAYHSVYIFQLAFVDVDDGLHMYVHRNRKLMQVWVSKYLSGGGAANATIAAVQTMRNIALSGIFIGGITLNASYSEITTYRQGREGLTFNEAAVALVLSACLFSSFLCWAQVVRSICHLGIVLGGLSWEQQPAGKEAHGAGESLQSPIHAPPVPNKAPLRRTMPNDSLLHEVFSSSSSSSSSDSGFSPGAFGNVSSDSSSPQGHTISSSTVTLNLTPSPPSPAHPMASAPAPAPALARAPTAHQAPSCPSPSLSPAALAARHASFLARNIEIYFTLAFKNLYVSIPFAFATFGPWVLLASTVFMLTMEVIWDYGTVSTEWCAVTVPVRQVAEGGIGADADWERAAAFVED